MVTQALAAQPFILALAPSTTLPFTTCSATRVVPERLLWPRQTRILHHHTYCLLSPFFSRVHWMWVLIPHMRYIQPAYCTLLPIAPSCTPRCGCHLASAGSALNFRTPPSHFIPPLCSTLIVNTSPAGRSGPGTLGVARVKSRTLCTRLRSSIARPVFLDPGPLLHLSFTLAHRLTLQPLYLCCGALTGRDSCSSPCC